MAEQDLELQMAGNSVEPWLYKPWRLTTHTQNSSKSNKLFYDTHNLSEFTFSVVHQIFSYSLSLLSDDVNPLLKHNCLDSISDPKSWLVTVKTSCFLTVEDNEETVQMCVRLLNLYQYRFEESFSIQRSKRYYNNQRKNAYQNACKYSHIWRKIIS